MTNTQKRNELAALKAKKNLTDADVERVFDLLNLDSDACASAVLGLKHLSGFWGSPRGGR